jgi:hypothetical protein
MPKSSFFGGLLRGLSSDTVKKVAQAGLKYLSPLSGDLVIKTGMALDKVLPGFGGILTDLGLRAAATLPSIADSVIDQGFASLGPNATVVPASVDDRAAALYPANVAGTSESSGLFNLGTVQPNAPQPAPRIVVEKVARNLHPAQFTTELSGVPHVVNPGTADAWGPSGPYLGDRNSLPTGAPAGASEAGWYFRPVGAGTNIQNDAPGYGELVPPKTGLAPMAKKRKVKVPALAPKKKSLAAKERKELKELRELKRKVAAKKAAKGKKKPTRK